MCGNSAFTYRYLVESTLFSPMRPDLVVRRNVNFLVEADPLEIVLSHNVIEAFPANMHETPYNANFFDIGACIGSLEYFEKEAQ